MLDSLQSFVQECDNCHIQFRIMYYVDGTYNLTYNGDTLTNIKTREGLTLIVGDIVYICIVNGNFSEKFIDCKRP